MSIKIFDRLLKSYSGNLELVFDDLVLQVDSNFKKPLAAIIPTMPDATHNQTGFKLSIIRPANSGPIAKGIPQEKPKITANRYSIHKSFDQISHIIAPA